MIPFHLTDETLHAIAHDSVTTLRQRSHLEACSECRSHVTFIRGIANALIADDSVAPSFALRERIHAGVRNQATVIIPVHPIANPRTPIRRWLIAAGVLLAAGAGWGLSRAHESQEMRALRSALALALSDRSPATRLMAINAAAASRTTDERVSDALTQSLLTDPSTNVRLAAAQALGAIASPVALRKAAQQSMRDERSPFVQSALLAAIARLSSADRNALLHALLARTDLDPLLRAQAEARTRS